MKFIIYSKIDVLIVLQLNLCWKIKTSNLKKMVDESPNDFFNEMKEKAPNMRTLPVILDGDELIGGYHELINYYLDE